MDKILPVGAVVLLEGAEVPLMIIGYQVMGEDKKERDYMGVPYPIGLVSMEVIKGFNHVDIKEILFNGFENNVLFDNFRKKIVAIKEKTTNN